MKHMLLNNMVINYFVHPWRVCQSTTPYIVPWDLGCGTLGLSKAKGKL